MSRGSPTRLHGLRTNTAPGRGPRSASIARSSGWPSRILSSAAWPDKSRIDDLYFTLDNSSPRPRDKAAPPQASAKKRKSLPHAEFLKLLGHLRSKRRGTARMLAGVVAFGALIGVRPIEWKDAQLDGETLFVRCAKHTNGRGLDEVREIELIGWKEIERQTFQRFLSAYQEAGEAADFVAAISRTIGEAPNQGMPGTPSQKRFSLHIAASGSSHGETVPVRDLGRGTGGASLRNDRDPLLRQKPQWLGRGSPSSTDDARRGFRQARTNRQAS